MIRHVLFVPVAGIAEIDHCITAALTVLPNQMDFFFIPTEVLSTVCVLCLKETTTIKKSHRAGNRHENTAF